MKKFFSFFFVLVALFGCTNPPKQPPAGDVPGGTSTESYHAHADFLVVLDGQTIDFNKAEYMSTPYKELDERVHLHDFVPTVIHFHAKGIALNDFFESLGMSFDQNCFESGMQKFCNDGKKTLQFYVNGEPNSEFWNYKPVDLDKLLIYFGPTQAPPAIISAVTNYACVYSKKCAPPPGFIAVPENCSIGQPCELPK